MDPAMQLDDRLARLATQLTERGPADAATGTVTIAALLPCEPVIGEVAVACWMDDEGGEAYELVRLDSGELVRDHAALRESLTLLAMTETLEEAAHFHELGGLVDALTTWRLGAGDTSALDASFARAEAALRSLHALAPGDGARIARTGLLDAMGAALRELDTAWSGLEQAAERWCDALLEPAPDGAAAIALVQDLWRTLGEARRGPLARPTSEALHAGREAGTAMASAIAEAMRG